jgi:DNA topoisomerase-2
MTELKIREVGDVEHILLRPDMYIGSIRLKSSEELVVIKSKSPKSPGKPDVKIRRRKIEFSPGLHRIFIEALSNAIDNVQRSKEAGVRCTKIKINIDRETGQTSVWNDGLTIPIAHNEGSDTYNHTIIFGRLRTSTNFDDKEERLVSGKNGLGIKLLNVFSKSFKVKGVDPTRKKSFVQSWTDNMSKTKTPKVSDCDIKNGFTEIIWTPDFERFGLENYTDDIINHFMKCIYDTAMLLAGIKIYFNDEVIPVSNLEEYAKLFFVPTDESITFETSDSRVVLTSSDTFEAISFVNGIYTSDGGRHVDTWSEALFRPIVEKFNKPSKPQVDIKDVKQFFRLFVVSTLPNPEFTSQSKTFLSSPNVNTGLIPVKKFDNIIKKIISWENTKRVNDVIESKEFLVLKKKEGKKRGNIKIDGYDPANEAGGKKSEECTLAICEGKSAKAFAIAGLDSPLLGKSGRDWLGILPIRGKLLNVYDASATAIAANKVITSIIKALRLRYGLDYTIDENYKTLAYGKLCILTDADTDGKHIAGLLINFIHKLFPTLLQRSVPFIVDMMTPIARFTLKNGENHVFYDINRADEFYRENMDKIKKDGKKYYKGLGSNNDEEVPEVFGKRVISYINDPEAAETISLAFHKKRADDRKRWLSAYNPNIHSYINEDTLEKAISVFFNEEFITYSIDSCVRGIPSVVDGWKQSHRKIAFAAFMKNIKKALKVSQFAGYVAENTNYHHGEENLHDTIIKLAQCFVGSNNIPLFDRDGQFGSRDELGKDASDARYIFILLDKLARKIFRDEDDDLMIRVIDDGDIVEPVHYAPIIPMLLINGSEGIGTGWSSTIPCYNPLDIVECVKAWIDNDMDLVVNTTDDEISLSVYPDIKPWYRGFKGEIIKDDGNRYITTGIVSRSATKKDQAIIQEIPVGMSIQTVKENLENLRDEKTIKDFRNLSGPNNAHFIIDEFSDKLKCTPENLKLTTFLSINNLIAFDKDGKIKKYSTIDNVLDDFCLVRLKYYVLRKAKIIKDTEKKIRVTNGKKRFITEIINDTLIIKKKAEAQIFKELEERGYEKSIEEDEEGGENPYLYLLKMNIRSFTEERIAEMEKLIVKMERDLAEMIATSEKKMWLNDLDEFVKAYTEWFDEMAKKDLKVEKRKKKANGEEKPKKTKKAIE